MKPMKVGKRNYWLVKVKGRVGFSSGITNLRTENILKTSFLASSTAFAFLCVGLIHGQALSLKRPR
jgi:hypothetical protein